MKYRALGTSGLKVSEICLGTMTWGTQNTEAEAHTQMAYALSEGVTFWDTAEMYPTNPVRKETTGLTERIIGSYFKTHGDRDKVILASKIAGPGRYTLREDANITPKTLRQALEASLKRLGTDYLDLYQLHWPNRGSYHFSQYWTYAGPGTGILNQVTSKMVEDLLGTLQTLDALIKEGKIRHWGLSNETAWGTTTFLHLAEKHQLARPVSLQNEYSLVCRLFEPDLAEVALRDKVGLLAWSPLAGGLLSGKYFGGMIPPGSRASLPGYSGSQRLSPMAHAAYDAYTTLARTHGLDPAQMAIAFTLAMPFTTSSIIGATTLEQLKTNIGAADITLAPEVLEGIAQLWRKYPMPY
jgi:aryl-alcohol dehydrogenase-like predicted oxidoreductase